MMRLTSFALCAVVVLVACDSQNPVSAPTPAPRPTPAPLPYTLSGVVRAAGGPVAGARVALLNDGGGATGLIVTDASGFFTFSAVTDVLGGGSLVSVSRPEYFTDTRYVPLSQGQTADFDLEPALYISVGEVIQSPTGGARCASLGYGGGGGAVCQRFAVTVPASGTLEVAVSSTPAADFDLTVLRPDGTIGAYNAGAAARLGVESGLTYQIDVVHITSTRDFELTTALR